MKPFKIPLFCAIVILFHSISFGQWDLITSQDSSISYLDIKITQDSTVYVCGLKNNYGNTIGLILRSNNFGTNWDTTFFSSACQDICFPSNTTGYALVDPNEVHKTNDGGNTWQFISNPVDFSNTANDIMFLTPDTGFLSFQDNSSGFYRTFDGGFTWEQMVDTNLIYGQQNIGGREIQSWNNSIYVTGGNYFLKSSDFGIHWSSYSNSTLYNTNKTIAIIEDTIWIAGSCSLYGCISKSNDGGYTWNTVEYQQLNYIHDIIMFTNSVGYMVSQYNDSNYYFMKTIDGGINWHYQQYNGGPVYGTYNYAIDCINDSSCFSAGNKGSIFKTINGGGLMLNKINESINNQSIFSVYPNPVDDIAILEVSYDNSKTYKIEIYNSLGCKIKDVSNIESDKIYIECSSLKNGMYFLRLLVDNITVNKAKMIVN